MVHLKRIFETVDFIVTPTTPITAPPIRPDALKCGESNLPVVSDLMKYVLPGNFAGNPAISVPVGHDSSGEPPGIFHQDELFGC